MVGKLRVLNTALLIMVILIPLFAYTANSSQNNNGLRIVVTINSLRYDVEPLLCLGDKVYSLIPQGVDPHDYELRPSDIRIIKESDIVISTAHTPFELRIRSLISKDLLNSTLLIEIPRMRGIKIFRNPLLGKPNLHAILYDPENLKIFIRTLANVLSRLRPECKTYYLERSEELINDINKLEKSVMKMKIRVNAIGYSPFIQYAVSWLGINVTYLLIKEHGVPPTPDDIRIINEMVREGRVGIIVLELQQYSKSKYVLPQGSHILLSIAKKYRLNVLYVPSPLIPNTTINKLKFIVKQLRNLTISRGIAAKESKGSLEYGLRDYLNYIALALLFATLTSLSYSLLKFNTTTYRLSLLLSMFAVLYSALVLTIYYDIKWVFVFSFVGISYGILSSLVSARRLYFLASASPHTALLAAVISIAISSILSINEYFWALIVGLIIIYIVGYMIHRGLDADIATSVLVSATSALSVIAIYFVLSTFRYSADVLAIIVGNPLLITWSDVLITAVLTIAIVVPVVLTYRENVYIGVDREDAIVSGARLWVYDLIAFTALALATIGLIKIVGFVLEHVLILLPGSIAMLSSRSSSEALMSSIQISLLSSIMGLHIASIINVAPSGMTGIILLTIYVIALLAHKSLTKR